MHGRALVVGGGIAGLAVARGLVRGGWDVEVRERLGGPPDTGGALGMWPAAMAALDRLDLGEQIRERAEERFGMALMGAHGRVLADVSSRRSVHMVSRSALLTTLIGGVPADLVRWNASAEAEDILHGTGFDVVVGADGINSLVRHTVFPGAPAVRPLGTVAFRGAVPGPVGPITETWGDGRIFGVTPLDADTTNWYAAVRADLLHSRADDRAAVLRDLFGGWHSEVARVLDALPGSGIDRRRLYDLPAFGRYAKHRHVVIGDAAHAMAPNLGRGACASLVDAVALADALIAGPTVESALTRYDRGRRRPTRRLVLASRIVNRVSTATRLTRTRDLLLTTFSRFV